MKASSEITSPSFGLVRSVAVQRGRMARVGQAMCGAAIPGLASPAGPPIPSATDGKVKITAKAAQRARELGTDVAAVPPCSGQVGLKEVEAYLARGAGGPRTG